jgi:hypothetical protein
MAEIRMPWSGDVAQTINPWTWWLRATFGQIGFINVNETDSGDPALEQRIVGEVASYGRQLGWISEALEIVLRHAKYADLSAEEQDSLTQFKRMLVHIDAIKAGAQRDDGRAEIDRLVRAIETLKRTDRVRFDAVAERLRPLVAAEPAPARVALPPPRAPAAPARKPAAAARKPKRRR